MRVKAHILPSGKCLAGRSFSFTIISSFSLKRNWKTTPLKEIVTGNLHLDFRACSKAILRVVTASSTTLGWEMSFSNSRYRSGGRGRLHCFPNRFLVWCCTAVWRHIATSQPHANSFQLDRRERWKEEIISRVSRKLLRFLCQQLHT